MVTVAYELSTKKQVFIDWALIEPGYGVQMKSPEPRAWEMPVGVRIVPHKPRIDWTPLVTAENPWEANVASHTILFKDGGKYRLYYRCARRRQLRDHRRLPTRLCRVGRRRQVDEANHRHGHLRRLQGQQPRLRHGCCKGPCGDQPQRLHRPERRAGRAL